jgi:hypothetical protein
VTGYRGVAELILYVNLHGWDAVVLVSILHSVMSGVVRDGRVRCEYPTRQELWISLEA